MPRINVGEVGPTKVCTRCLSEKTLDEFYSFTHSKRDGKDNYCIPCRLTINKERRTNKSLVEQEAQRNKYRENAIKNREQLKREMISQYSSNGACCCCNESVFEFLTLDHLEGVPDDERRQTKRGRIMGHALYRILKKKGWPSGYQVLCMNCNFAKGVYGICPHQN